MKKETENAHKGALSRRGAVALVAGATATALAAGAPTATGASARTAAPADTPPAGSVVWWHLRTTDVPTALRFYSAAFGWEFQAANELRYYVLVDGKPIGNLVGGQPQPEAPNTVLYITVPDLRATIATAERLGAKVVAGPIAVGGTTAFADLVDPNGTTFGLWTETWQG
ncbi:VOC family protein [Streptomyces sp. CA2R101]|uniref:VOC family protein n=1 Tax=Streptomyces sp. CA2R101 TaxID=3120152 RepID=UPI0030093BD8